MPRFLSAKPDAGLIPLPWDTPLAEWPTTHLVALPRGISRHVVRFIRVGEEIYAAKEVTEAAALHEYRMLQDLHRVDTPAVEPLAVVSGRYAKDGTPLDPVLVTRHLSYSLPYRSLFNFGVRQETVSRLLDAMVVLLARLHLIGFLWLDVSLSNILFRRDAGEFAAYLVDAETAESHATLTNGQREHDLDIATTNLFGEFSDLEAGRMLDEALQPLALVEYITGRYRQLWYELTGVEEFEGNELWQVEDRVRRLNNLGFDVAELEVTTDGGRLRIQPKVVDAGHHTRRLMRLTGLDAEEHQARRMLNDMDTFRAKVAPTVPESVAAHQWLVEVFEPAVGRIPAHLQGKRDAAQFFHEVLDHRWYTSQRENREVPTEEAAANYISEILTTLPDELLGDLATIGGELRDKYDPSKGFVDEDDDDEPYDPWKDGANDPEVELRDTFDIFALRAKAAAKEKKA